MPVDHREGLVVAFVSLVVAFVGWAAFGVGGILLGLVVPLGLYVLLRRRDR